MSERDSDGRATGRATPEVPGQHRDPAPRAEIVHPATGELLEPLDQQPAERLAAWTAQTDDLADRLKLFREDLDRELRRRLQLQERNAATFGDWEVAIEKPPREAVWDGDTLEGELRRLVDDGVVRAGELTGVITHETVVHKSEANKVIARLSGAARTAVEQCRTWRDKGKPKVKVVRSLPLIAEESPAAETRAEDGAGSRAPLPSGPAQTSDREQAGAADPPSAAPPEPEFVW